MRLEPYKYWSKEQMESIIVENTSKMSIDPKLKALIIDLMISVIYSEDWDVSDDFNGCTFVQDTLHPSIACLFHDYVNLTGRGSARSDKLFYELKRIEGLGKFRAKFRMYVVRFAYIFFFYWKITRKLDTPEMKRLFDYYKK